MKDMAIIRLRIVFLGIMGTVAAVGAIVLILRGQPVEGMAVFATTTAVVGIMGGAPRSTDQAGPTAPAADPAPAPTAPPAPAPVEQVTESTLVDWISTAERWGPDDLEAH